MTYKENITAILEVYFTGFKKEIIDGACNRILEQQRSVRLQEPKIGHCGLAEQFKEYWTSPYNEMNCRDCKEFEYCPCGKEGHESGTSQGYSIGECKDFEPQEREDRNE